MVRVGVVGLGMMGLTHLQVYRSRSDVEIAAICDSDPDRLSGKVKAAGNVEGQAMSSVSSLEGTQRCSDIYQLIGNQDIDLVDICLPTDMHIRFGCEVLQAGQHLMIEKPLARTSADAMRLVEAAEQAKGNTFVGHCMRFWPGWTWLHQAIQEQRYGKVYGAKFQRLVNHPGGPFYSDGARSGGAALDLHVHDTDFIQFCFGMPKAVTSFGYCKITTEADHLITHYEYDDVPLVIAEGSWAMTDGFTFNMGFTVNFEDATAVYDIARPAPLVLYEKGQPPAEIPVSPVMGYDLEIEYMLQCIHEGRRPSVVTARDAMNTLRIIEAETASVRTGRRVAIQA
jgi:predicted dehydrogenase